MIGLPKVITFDVWGTLLHSNPAYNQYRAQIVNSIFPQLSIPEIAQAFKQVKNTFDQEEIMHGYSIPIANRHLRVLQHIGLEITHLPDGYLGRLHRVFLAHRPKLTEQPFKKLLRDLQEKGIQTGILSNTGYIPGQILQEVLSGYGLHFDFYLFSDQVGYGKPWPGIFEQVRTRVPDGQYWHIGDNQILDGAVAPNFGHFVQVDTPGSWHPIFRQLQ